MTHDPDLFAARHNGPRGADIEAMLETVGADSLAHLIDQTIPRRIRQENALDIGRARTEAEALAEIRAMAARNNPLRAMIGQGYHGTHTPPVIQRNVLENPGWYTAYTPYQPEISQGRLEALLNFQTMITDLTGMEIANASLLDEATAAAEAMALTQRMAKSKATAFFCDAGAHPQTIALLRSRAEPLGWQVIVGDPFTDLDPSAVFGALFQYPATDGTVRDFRAQVMALHDARALAVFAADPLALTLLTPPGELGADVAIGTTQRFGVPMGMGGPHAAYFATRDAFKRSMPGRLIGVSIDARGRPAYRLSLQTREQHIRREKATSNICTAQVLLAVMAAMYASWHGPEGLTAIAKRVHRRATTLAMGLRSLGWTVPTEALFDTITVAAGEKAPALIEAARKAGIGLRDYGDGRIGIACDETTTEETVETLWRVFGGDYRYERVAAEPAIPEALRRKSAFLTHPVFSLYRSETDMMRYLRKLMDRDLALDRAMIPLGSCTMKLNAAAEMMPVTWPAFADVHPFAPEADTRGFRAMIDDLANMLLEITGYDAISMQPNSGAQGEFAGLMAIRRYHASRGESHRDICLIPSSAHGTNPASAQMAGMTVVVVRCDDDGNVDLADLTEKAEKHSDRLAACMITYPSTHGVFEEEVRDICEVIHDHGGQVYLDGANLNAQVGLARPGKYGADVSHLNLHKTFCIPHGGGGPGMGPIGVKEQLAPFLPGDAHLGQEGAISAAAFGSPLILPISWMYCRMMGGEGLTRATELAILNANYIARRLEGTYDVLYRGRGSRVAHECILDVRPFKDSAGVTVEDFAKRLIDYGFHAPTMSWPVAGTLMIEPTESESKAELDRFCDAMLAIREEIAEIEAGRFAVEDSPLRHAPHTVEDLVGDWDRLYSREEGVFPRGVTRMDKYWAPVGRVDNVHGDRNLVCSCPPMEAYGEAAE